MTFCHYLIWYFCEVYITRVGVRGHFGLWVHRQNQMKVKFTLFWKKKTLLMPGYLPLLLLWMIIHTWYERISLIAPFNVDATSSNIWTIYGTRRRSWGVGGGGGGWGDGKTNFISSLFLIVRSHKNFGNLYDITFISDRCHHSWAVATPGRYERDKRNLSYTFAIPITEKLTNGVLVTPTMDCFSNKMTSYQSMGFPKEDLFTTGISIPEQHSAWIHL